MVDSDLPPWWPRCVLDWWTRCVEHIHLESQCTNIRFPLVADSDIEQTARLPTEAAGNLSLEWKLMPRNLVSFEAYVPFRMTDQEQYVGKSSRPRNKDKVPADRLFLESCWWAAKELVYG